MEAVSNTDSDFFRPRPLSDGRLLVLTYTAAGFVPAIIDILLINSGQHSMRDGELVWGFLVMWSGNAAVAGIVWWAWRKVAVH